LPRADFARDLAVAADTDTFLAAGFLPLAEAAALVTVFRAAGLAARRPDVLAAAVLRAAFLPEADLADRPVVGNFFFWGIRVVSLSRLVLRTKTSEQPQSYPPAAAQLPPSGAPVGRTRARCRSNRGPAV
jgi:hypothetical protein